MSDFGQSDVVKPIKFQALPEDYNELACRKNDSKASNNKSDIETSFNRRNIEQSNFSLEYSYPAVTFENICFSVDKSRQQANFFEECVCRIKDCLAASVGADSGRKKVNILKSVNLSVPHGSIFGLLGPSSCGKTTLLRCLVRLLKPTSGSIRLFGHNLDARHSDEGKLCCSKGLVAKPTGYQSNKCKVPGANIGYMPQDLGLYEDFTIRQILSMFGRYMRMETKLINARIKFMAEFLDLPDVDRQIQSLSGGQKRRVSFAIACLHMPPLIILDEPTVGVDPLLRQSIWKYLRRLADEENKTIIITTHYIEEAAQADQVALMRAGEILVQDTPARIMGLNHSKTLEEAFLKICNNVQTDGDNMAPRYKLYPQPRFNWPDDELKVATELRADTVPVDQQILDRDGKVNELKLRAQEKMALFDKLRSSRSTIIAGTCQQHNVKLDETANQLSMAPNITGAPVSRQPKLIDMTHVLNRAESYPSSDMLNGKNNFKSKNKTIKLFRRSKFTLNDGVPSNFGNDQDETTNEAGFCKRFNRKMNKSLTLLWALLYKNYRRNVNSLPLLAFQFMLPIAQMISFSLCVGGRPTNIGLGLVNHDQLISFARADMLLSPNTDNISSINTEDYISDEDNVQELLSLKYLAFIDQSMLTIKPYDNLKDAVADVRRAKLWAVMEIGENFTTSISKRFDLENFYQLDIDTIHQSVIKLYPDKSNKILDMICHRSLVNSYRKFLLDHFEHFKRLPIEVREPIFDIKPNVISNSIDGYTESIAPGLLASLTYIMAAGLTTFIMVVERSAGILERTFTSGINPVAYLLAHAIFRSLVMMLQIAVVLILTFYVLQQPLVGSLWLAYLMLITLNLTGISYGLLISSIVTDQNGAALTIVSSLVVKITMSGILWPFEAIPGWLRTICYIQPLTMPVQALKAITLKGSGLGDRAVNLGFLVSISWLVLFLIVSAKRFRFYQH